MPNNWEILGDKISQYSDIVNYKNVGDLDIRNISKKNSNFNWYKASEAIEQIGTTINNINNMHNVSSTLRVMYINKYLKLLTSIYKLNSSVNMKDCNLKNYYQFSSNKEHILLMVILQLLNMMMDHGINIITWITKEKTSCIILTILSVVINQFMKIDYRTK